MKTTQEKLTKTSKTLSVILKIVEVFTIVGAVLSAAALIVILCNRADLARFFVDMGEVPDPQVAEFLMPFFLGLAIPALAVAAIACYQLYRIFRDISREGTPFAHKHVRRIKTVAWLTLPSALFSGTIPKLVEAVQTGKRMLEINIAMEWIVFGAIIYCLAFIFDYGCQLQQESDETL